MIIPLTDPALAVDLLPLLLKTKDLFCSPHGYIKYLQQRITDMDNVLVLVNIEGKKMTAVAFIEAYTNITNREAMINFAYVDPRANGVGKELWGYVEKWAKWKGCQRLSCITSPSKVKAMMKKYGFDRNMSRLSKNL